MDEITIDVIDNSYRYFNIEAESTSTRDVLEFVVPDDNQAYNQFLTQFMAEPMVDDQNLSNLLEQDGAASMDGIIVLNSSAPFIDFSAADIGSANDYNFN